MTASSWVAPRNAWEHPSQFCEKEKEEEKEKKSTDTDWTQRRKKKGMLVGAWLSDIQSDSGPTRCPPDPFI